MTKTGFYTGHDFVWLPQAIAFSDSRQEKQTLPWSHSIKDGISKSWEQISLISKNFFLLAFHYVCNAQMNWESSVHVPISVQKKQNK